MSETTAAGAAASEIRIEKLTKRFGNLVAVDAVDLTIGAGEVMCLLGPSGCGKTTTLRMVAGLEFATEGAIWLGGRRVDHLPARQRNVAMSFQFYALYASISVADNLAYPLHAEGLGRAEIERRVKRVAEILQLDRIMDRLPDQLSEGEKQRVAVGRSIVRDPTCFLFDEPLSRLDVQLREQMRGEIKEVLSGLAKPSVIVTHDQLEALSMADRIAVMQAGIIEQVATPHEIFARPENVFVAGFIGTPQMNLIPATVTGREGRRLRLDVAGQAIGVEAGARAEGIADGASVTLGVRPRAFALTDETEDSLVARVDIVEPMGAETLLHLIEGDQDLRVVVPRTVRPSPGEQVRIRHAPDQAHLFDETGRRVSA
ncbi:MAG: ABC transporter ATP-binding protein [Azospirillaceae bacterium]